MFVWFGLHRCIVASPMLTGITRVHVFFHVSPWSLSLNSMYNPSISTKIAFITIKKYTAGIYSFVIMHVASVNNLGLKLASHVLTSLKNFPQRMYTTITSATPTSSIKQIRQNKIIEYLGRQGKLFINSKYSEFRILVSDSFKFFTYFSTKFGDKTSA